MATLIKSNIEDRVNQQLPEWKFKNNSLYRELTFRNFVEAFSFMTAIAIEAEKMHLHPDCSNVYTKVNINLSTHSEGGVTENDFNLAGKIDKIFANIGGK